MRKGRREGEREEGGREERMSRRKMSRLEEIKDSGGRF